MLWEMPAEPSFTAQIYDPTHEQSHRRFVKVWRIGAAKENITYFEPGIGLLGWGNSRHVAYAVESQLYARAFCFQVNEGAPHFWVEIDTCFVSVALWQAAYRKLQELFPTLRPSQLMITANHTHAAPGGYSYHLLYHLNTPGFHAGVFEKILNGIVNSAKSAFENRIEAELFFNFSSYPTEVPIAFNRAMEAYLKNPMASTNKPEAAVDRTAYQLNIHPGGHFINWFGTHTTTIQEENLCISSDHKGYASELCEEASRAIAAFAQTTAGDVTPNHFTFPGVRVRRGPTPNPFENRRLIGRYQAEMSQKLLREQGEKLSPHLKAWWRWVDFSHVEVEEPYTRGMGRGTTGPGAIGVAFIGGTAEGGGVSSEWVRILTILTRLRGLSNPPIHGTKPILIESVTKKIFGTRRWDTLPLPSTDPVAKYLHWLGRQRGRYVPFPLTPQVLPLQVWQLDSIAIVALPMEPTTMAGQLIRERLSGLLAPRGVRHIIVQGYSNGYAGYLTTYWEYQYQRYEGAHTHFGKFTLAAVEKLLSEMILDKGESAEEPPFIPLEQARKVLFTYEVARSIQ
ncbi:MAG: neutral/alkaline non-lysosomal ceramidase N-terminal domain-containing protein [Bacteroidia bacterium]|nr:neutral/alkaline non-lysosomal ceramidase N-terminal domain-containing protein [Bacteroidia bacterium]MDW8133717.1 neutral/alkaline non-lysosomal ceramidase N-terminal domain-containing protein [Bacteroidia bacterium]